MYSKKHNRYCQLVERVQQFIVKVKTEELHEVPILVDSRILSDLIPDDVLLFFAFKAEIVLTFRSPDVLVQDDARDSVVDINVAELLVSTNLEAVLDLVIGGLQVKILSPRHGYSQREPTKYLSVEMW